MRVLIANDYATATGGRLPELDALDLAPTFRALLGLGTPERMSGAPLSGFEARPACVG